MHESLICLKHHARRPLRSLPSALPLFFSALPIEQLQTALPIATARVNPLLPLAPLPTVLFDHGECKVSVTRSNELVQGRRLGHAKVLTPRRLMSPELSKDLISGVVDLLLRCVS